MIQDIRLQHFRSYADDSFEFSPAVNIIVGPNASGKTNLLESILVVARGGSYRVKDTDLVEFGAPWTYKRTLAQRNSLLKKGYDTARSQIFAWDVRLSEQAGKIVQARQELVLRLDTRCQELYKELSHTETQTTLKYHSPLPLLHYESHLLKQLEARLELDVLRGFTSLGPHREDMTVEFDGRHAAKPAHLCWRLRLSNWKSCALPVMKHPSYSSTMSSANLTARAAEHSRATSRTTRRLLLPLTPMWLSSTSLRSRRLSPLKASRILTRLE
jgi:recombinational DNA repair ATPase RecF